MSYQTEVNLISPANDVWGAIFAATSVFPQVLPELYEEIKPSRRDGYNQGSMRNITYGPDFSGMVTTAEEEITEVDHDKMRVRCTVVAGQFVTKHYRSFDTITTVTPLYQGPTDPGCTVTWSCSYTDEVGSLSSHAVINLVMKTFHGVDFHLQKLIHS